MKVFGKERKKQLRQLEMDLRDAKAFNIILWFVLNAIAGVLNFGPKRLQRIYDSTLQLMYENRWDKDVGWFLEAWAIKNGLTEEAMLERMKGKQHENH